MYTDDYLSREIRDILSRKPDATHKEIVQALTYRARLKWGRIPPAVQLWQRGLDSADDITRKYRPDQPRVPAGSSEGGEWTTGLSLIGSQGQPKPSKLIRIAGGVFKICLGTGFSNARDKYGNSLGWNITFECADGFSFTRSLKSRTGFMKDPRKGRGQWQTTYTRCRASFQSQHHWPIIWLNSITE